MRTGMVTYVNTFNLFLFFIHFMSSLVCGYFFICLQDLLSKEKQKLNLQEFIHFLALNPKQIVFAGLVYYPTGRHYPSTH